jgi:hypothetical protein
VAGGATVAGKNSPHPRPLSRCAGEGELLPASGLEDFCQLVLDLTGVGEAGRLLLGEEIAVAEGDLEDSPFAGDEGDSAREVFRVIVKDVFRQPGGFLEVPSRGAVLDPNLGGRWGFGHNVLLSL